MLLLYDPRETGIGYATRYKDWSKVARSEWLHLANDIIKGTADVREPDLAIYNDLRDKMRLIDRGGNDLFEFFTEGLDLGEFQCHSRRGEMPPVSQQVFFARMNSFI